MSAADVLLERLERVRASGAGWTARCPAHEDRTATLSVSVGDDERVLVHCHAGCSTAEVVAAVHLTVRDLFHERHTPAPRASTVQRQRGLTLEVYATAKKLPLDLLRLLEVTDTKYLGADAVRIPYIDADGNTFAVRYRLTLTGDDKFRWRKGAKPCLYGLNRLSEARERGYVILVEGESDAHTLWNAGFPALGLPGANGWREDRDAALLVGLDAIYAVIEPDKGGEAVLSWLASSGIRERVRLVELDNAEDVSEAYVADPETFIERFEGALQQAMPWAERERIESALGARAAWEKCADLARQPRILDCFGHDLHRTGLVGERQAARVLYLALTSRLLDRPVSVAVKGPSSAGKSFVVQKVAEFLPSSAYYALTAMSERALAYGTEPLAHRFLILYEAGGLEGELASYLVRSLLSEGRVRYETVEKTPAGLKPRVIEREGPTGLLVTTTQIALHPENETRLLSITVTDTPEQTKFVLLALVAESEAVNLGPWRALQEWLSANDNRVVIPYARTLAELVPPVAVRLRRDFGALLNLVRAHAVLHQASRARDERGRIIATVEDYAIVRELVHQQMSEGVEATVPATVRETVEAVARLTDENGVALTALAKALDIDKSAASRRWQRARARGYLRNLESGKGKPARIVAADPLPDDVEVLPPPELVADIHRRCTVADKEAAE